MELAPAPPHRALDAERSHLRGRIKLLNELLDALPPSRARSCAMILEVPLPTAQSFAKELPIEARDAGALVRALGLKQRVLARPLAGRPLGGSALARSLSDDKLEGAPKKKDPELSFSRFHECLF